MTVQAWSQKAGRDFTAEGAEGAEDAERKRQKLASRAKAQVLEEPYVGAQAPTS